MLSIDFTSNPNGKLFCDIFSDIRLFSASFEPSTECEISLSGQLMGFATIVKAEKISFCHISDSFALINCGKPAPYQASLLNRYYNAGKMLPAETIFQIISFRWIQRIAEVQNILIKEWWENQTCKVD